MKKILLIAIGLFLSLSSFAQIKSATLSASGLTCSMCSKAIYKALTKLTFVQRVDADIEGSKYHISFRPGTQVVLDDLKNAVENAGFSVAALQVTADFPPTQLGKDAHISYGGAVYHFINVPEGTIAGEKTFTIVDKNFLPESQYKRYAAMTDMKCIHTGRMEACCDHSKAGTRVYHVTL